MGAGVSGGEEGALNGASIHMDEREDTETEQSESKEKEERPARGSIHEKLQIYKEKSCLLYTSAALITTKGTMDKASPEVRKSLAERADMLLSLIHI